MDTRSPSFALRFRHAWAVLTGRAHVFLRDVDQDFEAVLASLETLKDKIAMSAIDDLNAAVTSVTNYVGTLKAEAAAADQTPAIEAAATALNALVPAAAPAADPAAPAS